MSAPQAAGIASEGCGEGRLGSRGSGEQGAAQVADPRAFDGCDGPQLSRFRPPVTSVAIRVPGARSGGAQRGDNGRLFRPPNQLSCG